MMRRIFLPLALLAASCGTADQAPSTNDQGARAEAKPPAQKDAPVAAVDPRVPPLTAQGWGPLTIGMPAAAIDAALGPDADPGAVGGADPAACDQYRPRRAPAGLLVMVERGRLTRISLVRDSTLRTAEGIGLGDSREKVASAYPEAMVTPHKYVQAPAAYLDVWQGRGGGNGFAADADSRGIRFEINGEGVVGAIHAGGPSIQYVEGCS